MNWAMPKMARPMRMVSCRVGVSHVGSRVPRSISQRSDIAMDQNVVATSPAITPPMKMKPDRLSVPIADSSPTTRPPTAKAAPKRNAGITP
jgi:hypothetical protein